MSPHARPLGPCAVRGTLLKCETSLKIHYIQHSFCIMKRKVRVRPRPLLRLVV